MHQIFTEYVRGKNGKGKIETKWGKKEEITQLRLFLGHWRGKHFGLDSILPIWHLSELRCLSVIPFHHIQVPGNSLMHQLL